MSEILKQLQEVEFSDEDFEKSKWSKKGKPYWCVEVGTKDGVVAVRDSKDPATDPLRFSNDEWDAFVRGVKDGQFDI